MSTLGKRLIAALKEAHEKKDGLTRLYPSADVAALRRRLELSQREFAELFQINLETLRTWEQGKRKPDSVSSAFLRCIEKDPFTIQNLLHS